MAYRDDFRDVQREAWWSLPRIFGALVVGVVLLYGLGFLMTGGDLFIYKFWAPKQANAENQVFHNTQAFVDGKNTYIVRLCRESQQATGAQKTAIDGEILQEASTIDPKQLNPDAAACVDRVKGL